MNLVYPTARELSRFVRLGILHAGIRAVLLSNADNNFFVAFEAQASECAVLNRKTEFKSRCFHSHSRYRMEKADFNRMHLSTMFHWCRAPFSPFHIVISSAFSQKMQSVATFNYTLCVHVCDCRFQRDIPSGTSFRSHDPNECDAFSFNLSMR